MDRSIDDEYQDEGRLQKSNGLGFLGGPTWHYPEEEIEFYPIDHDESLAEDSDIESCSCSSMDNFRIAMIENYIETHDILDDQNLDFLLSSNHRNIDYALSQPPPSVSIIERSSKRSLDNLEDDHFHTSDLSSSRNSNSISNSRLPEISPSSLKKPTSWIRPSSKRRRRPDCKVSISSDTTMKEQKFHLFREATMCVPFEYATKLATFYIRRPYGAVTVPEMFRALSPVTDEEYEKNSQVSSSKTIQVAISVSADNSMMLLYGSSGVRYNKSSSNDWVDVPDVGIMDNPLGYVNKENLEYSLDEILEEAMFVREQYCSTIMSAALEAEECQLSGPTKSLSPPSLAKSIVSTPPRSNYYYDGSGHDTSKVEEQDGEEEIEARKLDFMNCVSPSFKGSIGSTSNYTQKQRKRRRKQVYRFFQRLVFVIGFYVCAIFLVGNLFGVDYHLSGIVPQSAHNPVLAMFFQNKEVNGDKKPTTEIVATNERIQRDHDVFAKKMADERDSYKRNLKTTQALLREQEAQNHALSKKYALERNKTEKLQKEQDNAAALVQNLLDETETLAVDLKTEQGERRKLEQTIQELELQLTFLIQDKIRMEADLKEATHKAESSEAMLMELEGTNSVGENRSLEKPDPIYENEGLVGADELLLASPINSIELLTSDKNKVEVFASSLRTAVTKNFQKILRKNKNRSDSQLDWPRENLSNDAFLAQYRPLKFLDDNKAIREILKTSTRRVLKQSKDNSDMVLHSVKHNVDEVSIAGIKKMDHGQEAIKVVGDFAKKRLGAINRRAKRFGKRWHQKTR